MPDDLTLFAIRNGTDKFGYHDYTPNYHSLFARFRNQAIRVLEIGVGGYGEEDRGGESLATWRDYFPLARIVGLDIQKKVLDLGPRVRIVQGSQVDAGFLAQVVAEEGPFDLIIDDGSHQNDHVIESFKLLFPTLAPGGIYAVEDTQTAFFPGQGGGPDLQQPNSIGFFKQLLDRVLTGAEGPDITGVPADGLCGIERFHNIVALHKASADAKDGHVSWLAGLANPEDGPPKHIVQLDQADTESLTPDSLYTAFRTIQDEGALVFKPAHLSPATAAFLLGRFVEIDHMEQRVHFPDYPVHPVANELRALSVTETSIALWRAPNLYPSNFSFDPQQPQAAKALAIMQDVLGDGKPWPGAITLARLWQRFAKPEVAYDLIRRFGRGEGQSRSFFNIASSVLAANRRHEDLRPLLETGVELYPRDARLVFDLAGTLMRDGKAAEAELLLAEALSHAPHDRLLLSRMARAKDLLGKLDAAAEHTELAILHGPANTHLPLRMFLVRVRLKQGNAEAAQTILNSLNARDVVENDQVHRLMSEVQMAMGNRAEALKSIDLALSLAPNSAAHERWRKKIVA